MFRTARGIGDHPLREVSVGLRWDCCVVILVPGIGACMTPDELIAKWAPSGGAEMANAQGFIIDLCDVLGVARPDPTQPNEAANAYVFEKAVRHSERGVTSTNRIDCYKRGHFILESKQSLERGGAQSQGRRAGRADGRRAWRRCAAARRVAGRPAGTGRCAGPSTRPRTMCGDLPVDHPAPLFLIVVDVGHVIELYADFSGRGAITRSSRTGPRSRSSSRIWPTRPCASGWPGLGRADRLSTRRSARPKSRGTWPSGWRMVAARLEGKHRPAPSRRSSCAAFSRCSPRMSS